MAEGPDVPSEKEEWAAGRVSLLILAHRAAPPPPWALPSPVQLSPPLASLPLRTLGKGPSNAQFLTSFLLPETIQGTGHT